MGVFGVCILPMAKMGPFSTLHLEPTVLIMYQNNNFPTCILTYSHYPATPQIKLVVQHGIGTSTIPTSTTPYQSYEEHFVANNSLLCHPISDVACERKMRFSSSLCHIPVMSQSISQASNQQNAPKTVYLELSRVEKMVE